MIQIFVHYRDDLNLYNLMVIDHGKVLWSEGNIGVNEVVNVLEGYENEFSDTGREVRVFREV